MDITGKTALVTGANRGLGRHLAAELRDRGARVYAAARDPQAVDLAGVTPIALDITDPASVAAAARAASEVAILDDRSAVLNILSALSWLSIPRSGAYSAAKSAEWSLTNALRLELAAQGTRVTALHVGYMDTDMTRYLDVPKSDPGVIAKLAIDGVEAGDAEIIADETSRRLLAGLSAGVAGLYHQVA
jgi:NAD(P)-dependent dehydrogenase (short-subunit alcohol dehydrogenase family)